MKYFIDTEFKEYLKQHRVFGIPVGYPTPTIDLISIGIVCEDGRSYYALNKECDLNEICEDEWLWEHVITPIYQEHVHGDARNYVGLNDENVKAVFNSFGRTKKQIREEIKQFIYLTSFINNPESIVNWEQVKGSFPIDFYGYFADYDWVVFCQLFGRMLDLPKGFPMYCRDLKQMMDDYGLTKEWKQKNCPDPKGEHNALVDAKWNLDLYNKIILT